MVRLTFLGTGTSTGVPLIHCKCKVCRSTNPRNKRLRASVVVHTNGKTILIDPSIDLRQQALRAKLHHIDAVLVTHPHADHIGGVDELRSYNFVQKQTLPMYVHRWSEQELLHRFRYIFAPEKPIEGGGVASIDLHLLSDALADVEIQGVPVRVLPTRHGSEVCLGFRFGRLAYVTDCHWIPPETLAAMQGLEVLVLDCLRITPHSTHFNLDQALETVALLKPKKTFLTHLGHDFDDRKWKRKLPKGVFLAYDGLQVMTSRKGSLRDKR